MDTILVSLAFALIAGLLMSRAAKLVNLPAVTAYLIAGLLIGPFCLGRLNIAGLGFNSLSQVIADFIFRFRNFCTVFLSQEKLF